MRVFDTPALHCLQRFSFLALALVSPTVAAVVPVG